MIKLNDTVSFVDVNGQAHTGTVDAFRGQGMADLTLTDGVQVRQPVSSLSPVRSNPRVNIRSNPRVLVRKNPQDQGSDVDLQRLLRTIGVQAGKSDHQIDRLFAQDPITEQEARALTQLLKDLIHALGVGLRRTKSAALTVRMRQLPVLPSNQRDELSEKIEAALQERTQLDSEKTQIVKTRDQLLAMLERANELQELQASIPKTLDRIQEWIDALTRTTPFNAAAQAEVSKQVAQYEDRRVELQQQLSAVNAELKALPPHLQESSAWRKAWFNNQNKPSVARQEEIERRINLLDATMEAAKKKLLEMPEWMRFFSKEAYEAELKKLDDEVAQAQLDLSQKLGPTIAERQNRKAQPAQFVQGLQMPSLPMAAELAQLLVQMGKTPAQIQDTLNGQNRGLLEYALRGLATDGVKGLKEVLAKAEVAQNEDLKRLNEALSKSDLAVEKAAQNLPNRLTDEAKWRLATESLNKLREQNAAIRSQRDALRATLVSATFITDRHPEVVQFKRKVSEADKAWRQHFGFDSSVETPSEKETPEVGLTPVPTLEEYLAKPFVAKLTPDELRARLLEMLIRHHEGLPWDKNAIVVKRKDPEWSATPGKEHPVVVVGRSNAGITNARLAFLIATSFSEPTTVEIPTETGVRKLIAPPVELKRELILRNIDEAPEFTEEAKEAARSLYRLYFEGRLNKELSKKDAIPAYIKIVADRGKADDLDGLNILLSIHRNLQQLSLEAAQDIVKSLAPNEDFTAPYVPKVLKEFFSSIGIQGEPSLDQLKALYDDIQASRTRAREESARQKEAEAEQKEKKATRADILAGRRIAHERLSSLGTRLAKKVASERVDEKRALREERERAQGVPIGDLTRSSGGAAYAIVSDPIRYSPRKERVCGNALDGKAYTIAVSQESRNIRHYITWRDVGITNRSQLKGDQARGDVNFNFNAGKVAGGTSRAMEVKQIDLDFLLNNEKLNLVSAAGDRYAQLDVENLTNEKAKLYRYSLSRKDKGFETITNLTVTERLPVPEEVESKLQSSLAGRQANGRKSNQSLFIVVKDYKPRVGKGRSAQEYSLPPVAQVYYNVEAKSAGREPRAEWSPDDPILFVNDAGEAFGFLIQGKIATSADLLRAPFNIFNRFSSKDRDPYYSWVPETSSLLGEGQACPDTSALAELAAVREVANTMRKYQRSVSMLELGLVKDNCAATWDEQQVSPSLEDCLRAAITALESGDTQIKNAIQVFLGGYQRESGELIAKLDLRLTAIKLEMEGAASELKKLEANAASLETQWYSEKAKGKDPTGSPTKIALEYSYRIENMKKKLKQLEDERAHVQSEMGYANRMYERYLQMTTRIASISEELRRIKQSMDVRLRQNKDLGGLWNNVCKALRGTAFMRDRIEEERVVSAYRGRPSADYSVLNSANSDRLEAIYIEAENRIPALARIPDQEDRLEYIANDVATITTASSYMGRLAKDAVESRLVVPATVTKGAGNKQQTYVTYEADDKIAELALKRTEIKVRGILAQSADVPYANTKLARLEKAAAEKPSATTLYLLVKMYEGKNFFELLRLMVDMFMIENDYSNPDMLPDKLTVLEAAANIYTNMYATTDNEELFFFLAKMGGADQKNLITARNVLNRYKADVEFTAYYNADLCEGHEFRSRQTQEEEFFRFPSAAKIQKQIRMITSKVLSNAEFRFEGIKRDTEMTIFRSSFGVLRDVMTFLSERACTMIENVRFFGTEMNRKSTLLLMQYVDILRAPKLTGEISSRFTRVQTIKQPKAYVAFSQSPYGKDSSYSEPELEQELRPFGLSQTWAATTYISRILARKGVETPTARIVTIQAEQHPYVAEEMQSRSKRPETIKKRDKRRMEEARAAVGWVLQFPSVEQAEKAAKVIQQKMPNAGLLVTDNLHSLNNFVRYSFKDKDDKPIPLQGLPKPREDQGAQVVTEEEENPYSKKLEQAVNDFEIAIKGRPSTRKLVTPMRSEGSKERGFEVFYTYNPLLFQLTRLYLPSLRQGGEMSPWRSWLTTKAGKDGTPKIHMRYPELADSVEAIGLYGSLLALLRYGAMTFEVDAGRTPSSLSDIIEGVKLYSGEKVPESFLKMEPKGWMGADSPMMFDDWAAVYEKRLLGDETSLTQLMQRLKKAAVVGLNEAARLGTEGLYLPHHQEGVEGRAFSELTQVPKTEGKDVPALDIDETNPTTVALATYIKRTLPLIAKAASLYTTEGGKFVMGTADDALVKFWESLKSENVKIGEPDAATAKKLTPEKKLKEYRPLSVLLDPQRGNLLRILGAQPNDPRQGFSLEDVEVKLAKGVLPTVVLPWLANRLLVLHALTGKSGYAANVSPMPPLSAGAGQTIPEPEDSYLAQAQREHAKRLELLNVINNALDDR